MILDSERSAGLLKIFRSSSEGTSLAKGGFGAVLAEAALWDWLTMLCWSATCRRSRFFP